MRSWAPGPPPSPFCSLFFFFFLIYLSIFFFFFCLTPCIVKSHGVRVLACKAKKKGSEAFPSDTFQCRPSCGGAARGEERSDCLGPGSPVPGVVSMPWAAPVGARPPPAASMRGPGSGKASDVSDGLSGRVNSLWPRGRGESEDSGRGKQGEKKSKKQNNSSNR